MPFIATMLINLLKGYVVKLATKEIAHYILMEIAEAIVKSTKNTHDDKLLAKMKEVLNAG